MRDSDRFAVEPIHRIPKISHHVDPTGTKSTILYFDFQNEITDSRMAEGMMRRLTSVLVAISALSVGASEHVWAFPGSPFQDAIVPLIKNGTFADWKDELPVGWTVEIGATIGADSPKSQIKQGPGPSLELSGDAKTRAWHSVGQTIDVMPGQSLLLSYEGKAVGVKREGRQFDSCYVALFPKTTDGSKSPPLVWPVDSKEYKSETCYLQVAKNVSQYQLLIFLSKTGKLNIKNIKLEEGNLKPEDSFDVLVEDMAKHYSFFELKKIDWDKLSRRYRQRAIKAQSPERFSQFIAQMLDELKDTHVWVNLNGKRYGTFSSRTTGQHDFRFVKKDLSEIKGVGRLGTVGKSKDGFCYVNIRTLANVSQDELRTMSKEIANRFDAPGFILDLRENVGGSELIAQDIAGLFTNDEVIYAKSVRRNGDKRSDFADPTDRILRPTAENEAFPGPIVCLIGPNTVSSAEGFALMMKAIPNCTLVGQPTRGASGNPAALHLPNGVEVWYSRWQSLTPDGVCIEDIGVEPAVKVTAKPGSDAAYEKAIEILRRKSKRD
jgi:hypothetical protein